MSKFKEFKAQLLQAQKVVAELDAIAKLDESLAAQTKGSLNKAKESLVLQKLAELPVDNMKDATDIRVSGSLDNHYSPVAQVLLDIEPQPGDGFIALSQTETPEGVHRLASPKNEDEFARLLYAALRSADTQKLSRVIVRQPEGTGISIAIRDRLQRASRGR